VSDTPQELLRTTFEQVPELYDRARPSYPPQIFDDLAALAQLPVGARLVEIGCGTSQAQRALDKQTGSILDWQQSAAVGLSTCAAYSGDQNLSFGLSESRRRLIWSLQTLDNAAMTANVRWTRPAPVPSLAESAGCSSATCERFTVPLVNPRKAGDPLHGRSGDHRAHSDGCQRLGRPRPPNQAETTLGKPKRLVLAS
jgi:hypothetical protein